MKSGRRKALRNRGPASPAVRAPLVKRGQLPPMSDERWTLVQKLGHTILRFPGGSPTELMPHSVAQRLHIDAREEAIAFMYAMFEAGAGDLAFFIYHDCYDAPVDRVPLGCLPGDKYECPYCEKRTARSELTFEHVLLIQPFRAV
mgnify:CR=1 FL=1